MQSIGSPSGQIIRGVAVASRTAFQDVGADHRRLHGPVALERTPSHNRRRGASRKTFDCSDPFFLDRLGDLANGPRCTTIVRPILHVAIPLLRSWKMTYDGVITFLRN